MTKVRDVQLIFASPGSYSTETDRWSVGARLPGGSRSQHAAVKRRERILVSGGLDHDHQVLDTLLEFCPQQESWREVSKMPRPRADHAMILYDDMVYFVGGWRDSGEGRVLVPEVDRCVRRSLWQILK